MNSKTAVETLAAIAQESRLAIFRLLVKRGPEGFAAGQIAERLDIPSPTLSFHLKALDHAGLVLARREGRFLYYSANFERMNDLVGYLTENCCGLATTGCAPTCPPVASGKSKKSA
jgi:DNA-binding transcriptional ArsR family regulator